MRHFLHLIVNPATPNALEAIVLQAARADTKVMVVVGPGVPTPSLPGGIEAYRLGEPDRLPVIDHAQLLELIFAADTVVTW